jgi:hypothetical protein
MPLFKKYLRRYTELHRESTDFVCRSLLDNRNISKVVGEGRVSQREKTSFPADHQDLNSGTLVIFIPENMAHQGAKQ